MARLLVLLTRPDHLTFEAAESWVRQELERLAAGGDTGRAVLTRLKTVSERHPRHWDWLLEVHLPTSADCTACIEDRPWVELLADLRLLGMRPAVAVAEDGTTLGEDAA